MEFNSGFKGLKWNIILALYRLCRFQKVSDIFIFVYICSVSLLRHKLVQDLLQVNRLECVSVTSHTEESLQLPIHANINLKVDQRSIEMNCHLPDTHICYKGITAEVRQVKRHMYGISNIENY